MTSLTHPIPAQAGRAEVERIHDGLHFDVPEPEYRRGEAWAGRMSKTTLGYGLISMAHLKAAWDGMLRHESDAMDFGAAFHCKLLEPERFAEQYAAMPSFGDMRSPTNRALRDQYAAEHEGVQFLAKDDWLTLEAMNASVRRHKAVRMLRAKGGCEVSLAWTAEGIKLKGRADKLIESPHVLIDLKTVRSCVQRDLDRARRDFAWDMQAALYVDGVKALTGEAPAWLWVFIEKSYPYGVAVRRATDELLSVGRAKYASLLQRWAHCLRTNDYPGFGDDIEGMDAASWELKEWGAEESL